METQEILNFLLWFTACFVVAYFFFDRVEEAAGEIREQQEATGAETLQDLYITMPPSVFFFMRTSIIIVSFVIGFLALNVFSGILLAFFGFIVPGWYIKRLKDKRVKKIEAQLIEGLELMGNALKSGLTLQQGIELLVREFPAPLSQEFNRVLAENRLGVELVEAMDNMAKRLDSSIVSILVSGVAITKRCGGDLTEIFSNIAQTIREQATIQGKLDAVTAQGRTQGMVLSIMPFALVVVLYFVDKTHVETLFGFQIGIYAICATVLMVMMAQGWIAQLLKIDV